MRGQWKKLLVVLLAIGLLGANTIILAEESAQGRSFSILSISGDEAYVTKGAVKEVKAAAGMTLGQGSKVRTGAQTSLYVQADGDKTIKLDSNTQVEITKVSSKALKITLKSGEMFFNVEKPLKSGEELTFDAAQTSMSIRGTSGILAYGEKSITFYLVEGNVQWKIGNETVNINAGQKVTLVPSAGEQLQANGMNSMYQLQGVEDFSWRDLSAMGLEAVMEQGGLLDLSSIGLEDTETAERAIEQLAQMKQEKEAGERAQAEREQQAREASGGNGTSGASGNIMRIDGKEPEIRSDSGDGGQSNRRRRETTPAPMPELPTTWNSTTSTPSTGDSTSESSSTDNSVTDPPVAEDTGTGSPTTGGSSPQSSTPKDTATESLTIGTAASQSPATEKAAQSPFTGNTTAESPTNSTKYESTQPSIQNQNALFATP